MCISFSSDVFFAILRYFVQKLVGWSSFGSYLLITCILSSQTGIPCFFDCLTASGNLKYPFIISLILTFTVF
jgi:hypothetical protein